MSTGCLKHGSTTPSGILQVTRDGVVHMAFHPRSDAIILAAGDKGGRLGIWHLDHDSFEVRDWQSLWTTSSCIRRLGT